MNPTLDPIYTDAACLEDGDLFFLPDQARGRPKKNHEAAAKAICARCPLTARCLDDALINDERYGVFGGTTPEERAALMADGARR